MTKPSIRTASTFLWLSGVWICFSAIPSLFASKASIHIFINSYNAPFADRFFAVITNLGDGWTIVPLVLALLFISYRLSLEMAAGNIVTGIVTQVMKRTIFSDVVRPSKLLEHAALLHTVPGVQLYSYESFPSGHAATVFVTCALLSFWTADRRYQAALWVIAVLVAFSRVYLSQHFLQDVSAGSMIGVLLGLGTSASIGRWAGRLPGDHGLYRSVIHRRERV